MPAFVARNDAAYSRELAKAVETAGKDEGPQASRGRRRRAEGCDDRVDRFGDLLERAGPNWADGNQTRGG